MSTYCPQCNSDMCRNGTKTVSYKDWDGFKTVEIHLALQRVKCTRCDFLCYANKPELFENFRITKALEQEIIGQCLNIEFTVIAKNLGLSAKTIRNVWINRQEKQFSQIGWNQVNLLRNYSLEGNKLLFLQDASVLDNERFDSSSLKGVFSNTTSVEFQQWLAKHPGGDLYTEWNLIEICRNFLPSYCALYCIPQSIHSWIEENLENFIRKAKNNWSAVEKNSFETIRNFVIMPFVARSVEDDQAIDQVSSNYHSVKIFITELDSLRSLFTRTSARHAEKDYMLWIKKLSVLSKEVFSSAIKIVNRVYQSLFEKEWNAQINQCYLSPILLPKIKLEYKISKLVGKMNHLVCNGSTNRLLETQYAREKLTIGYNPNS